MYSKFKIIIVWNNSHLQYFTKYIFCVSNLKWVFTILETLYAKCFILIYADGCECDTPGILYYIYLRLESGTVLSKLFSIVFNCSIQRLKDLTRSRLMVHFGGGLQIYSFKFYARNPDRTHHVIWAIFLMLFFGASKLLFFLRLTSIFLWVSARYFMSMK